MHTPLFWDSIKEKIGKEAAERFVPKSGFLGLGSGSTSLCFIKALSKKRKEEAENGRLFCIATSLSSEKAARDEGLLARKSDEEWDGLIDVTCDGADYIDIETGAAIKGFGGALLREKIVAQSSHRLILMVDERKVIPHDIPCQITIPIEVVPFGAYRTKNRIQELLTPLEINFRIDKKTNRLFQSDNGNFILDIILTAKSTEFSHIDTRLRSVSGVVETGIFVSLATDILIGLDNGDIQHRLISKK